MLASLHGEKQVKCYGKEILGFCWLYVINMSIYELTSCTSWPKSRCGGYEYGTCMRGLRDLDDLMVSSIHSRLPVQDSTSPLICTQKNSPTAGISPLH